MTRNTPFDSTDKIIHDLEFLESALNMFYYADIKEMDYEDIKTFINGLAWQVNSISIMVVDNLK